jgi:hypothetical protein
LGIAGAAALRDELNMELAHRMALGHVIVARQSRSNLVDYRDPAVLRGCPAASTFNAMQAGEIERSP